MKYYASKKFTCSSEIAEKDQILDGIAGEFFVKKGERILTDQLGNKFPVAEEYFQNNYMEVELVEDKHKYDRNELANNYAALSELDQNESQDYINGMEKLVKDKAF